MVKVKVDWIRMRTDLYRDPKVILMANLLVEGKLARYVNQNCQCDMVVMPCIMRNMVIGGLLSVWGVTRHRGKRDGHNLSLPCHTLETLDDIADIPGFGEAMQFVGWAVDTDTGIILPNFFREFNTDPAELILERRREGDRNRKRKSRGKGADTSRDGHVTIPHQRREEIREENKGGIPPLNPPPPCDPPVGKTRKSRKGKRFADLEGL